MTENAVHHVNGSSKTEASDNFRYWSFMSYSHADQKWADWLYKALETYRIPKGIKSAYASNLPKRLYPIFRDVDELPGSSDLGAKLKEALEASRTLIVLCSPSAAQSKWVNEEIGIFQAGEKVIVFSVSSLMVNQTPPIRIAIASLLICVWGTGSRSAATRVTRWTEKRMHCCDWSPALWASTMTPLNNVIGSAESEGESHYPSPASFW